MSRDPDPARWICSGCGRNTRLDPIDYYMLTDVLWKQIADIPRGMLCLSCAENRIGRRIVKEDLKDCLLNFDHPLFKSFFSEIDKQRDAEERAGWPQHKRRIV